ncbi:MAG: hypothetical protein QG602_2705 [Verrucomicrobiota bacterium]|nr:hypothetical protein [Verrucomicrobiota bacterium]
MSMARPLANCSDCMVPAKQAARGQIRSRAARSHAAKTEWPAGLKPRPCATARLTSSNKSMFARSARVSTRGSVLVASSFCASRRASSHFSAWSDSDRAYCSAGQASSSSCTCLSKHVTPETGIASAIAGENPQSAIYLPPERFELMPCFQTG